MASNKVTLPALITLAGHSGDVQVYFDNLYTIFKRDFLDSHPILFNKKVVLGDSKKSDGKEDVFWHITTKMDKKQGTRNTDLRRCEKMEWIRFAIENLDKIDGALHWSQPGDSRSGSYIIYLEKDNFVVILKELKSVFLLITAHHIDYKDKKAKLLKDYAKYKAKPAQ